MCHLCLYQKKFSRNCSRVSIGRFANNIHSKASNSSGGLFLMTHMAYTPSGDKDSDLAPGFSCGGVCTVFTNLTSHRAYLASCRSRLGILTNKFTTMGWVFMSSQRVVFLFLEAL